MITEQEIEKEDEYISFTASLYAEDGTNYEYWVHRSRIVKTGKYKVGGHITVSNPGLRLYKVKNHSVIEDIQTKDLAELETKILIEKFKEIILNYEDMKK